MERTTSRSDISVDSLPLDLPHRSQKKRARVWEHYETEVIDGKEKATCKYCKIRLSSEPGQGLLDPTIDATHRSFWSAVQGASLSTLRSQTTRQLLRLDPRLVPRLTEAGLIPLCRMVEAALSQVDPARRFDVDRSLLAALVDRWRPETRTFHLPCGEMAPTLKDISFLLGLPLAGIPVGPVDRLQTWKTDITERFEGVMRVPGLAALTAMPHYETHGPTKKGLLQFTTETMHPDAEEFTVTRCLESYLCGCLAG